MADGSQVDLLLTSLKYGGIFVSTLSGILGAVTKTHDRQKKFTRWGRVSVSLTVLGGIVAACSLCAESLRQRNRDVESRKRENEIVERLREQKEFNARSELEFREKFQAVLVQLNAAKHEDSRKITEEKIRVIQKDFSDWATNFVRNLPRIRSEFDKTKSDFEQGLLQAQIEAGKKEIQSSQEAFPVLSFAVRFIQESVRAFGNQTGKEIKIDPVDVPENLYEKETNCVIRFSGKASWKLSVSAR